MPEVPVRLRCTCGGGGRWSVTPRAVWRCPECGDGWLPDAGAVERVHAGARDLARLRHQVLMLVAGVAVIAAALVAAHPAWVLGAPLLVGGALLIVQPTYKRRRARALGLVRTAIPLSRS